MKGLNLHECADVAGGDIVACGGSISENDINPKCVWEVKVFFPLMCHGIISPMEARRRTPSCTQSDVDTIVDRFNTALGF